MNREEKALKERIRLNIKYLREDKNLKKSDMARAIRKTDSAIRDYENGKATPPTTVLLAYAEALDVYIGDLVGRDMWKGERSPADQSGLMEELNRALREKRLLHGTLEEQEAQLASIERELGQLIRQSEADSENAIKSGELQALLDILGK